MGTESRRAGSSRVGAVLLAAVSLAAAIVGAGVLGPLVALGALAWLVIFTLRRVGADPPPFPPPQPTLAWASAALRYVGEFVAWAAPYVPFLAPTIVFVAVTWPLPSESATLAFQEQASQIIPVVLIGYVIEAGAIRWRARSVDWLLSLVTVALLIAGETYALVAIANDDPVHADIVAGAMAAGVVAILAAAAQGVGTSPQGQLGAEYEKRPDPGETP